MLCHHSIRPDHPVVVVELEVVEVEQVVLEKEDVILLRLIQPLL